MDTAGATVDWDYAELCDPYGIGGVPHLQVEREYFVKAHAPQQGRILGLYWR
jgi:hypothetical protein